MATLRDLVRFEPNERVDLPDLSALQRNGRSDTRSSLVHALFGGDVSKVVAGWAVTPDSPASAFVDVAAGRAFLAETLADGTVEYGVAVGLEGEASQTLDFTGQPAATYGVWVRYSATAGEVGTRLFWNGTSEEEEPDTIDTRYVVAWDVQAATSSPGAEWEEVARVVWDGATVEAGDITGRRDMFFEGDEATTFGNAWGDGANDRNAARGIYGVGDLYTWVQAVRRQLQDMIGESAWYAAPNTNLALTATHLALTTDAHTANPTWTGTVTTADLEVVDDAHVGGQLTLDTSYVYTGSGITLSAKWAFTRLQHDGSDANILWGPSDTDPRYVYYDATGSAGPDLVLDLNELIGQFRSGSCDLQSIVVYWNHATLTTSGQAANLIAWSVERRQYNDPQGAWTVVDSGTETGGDYYDPANAPDILLINVGETPDDTEDWRLTLNLQGSAGGVSPFVYGGLVIYTVTESWDV